MEKIVNYNVKRVLELSEIEKNDFILPNSNE